MPPCYTNLYCVCRTDGARVLAAKCRLVTNKLAEHTCALSVGACGRPLHVQSDWGRPLTGLDGHSNSSRVSATNSQWRHCCRHCAWTELPAEADTKESGCFSTVLAGSIYCPYMKRSQTAAWDVFISARRCHARYAVSGENTASELHSCLYSNLLFISFRLWKERCDAPLSAA